MADLKFPPYSNFHLLIRAFSNKKQIDTILCFLLVQNNYGT